MSANIDCLLYAVGLSRTACECVGADKPADADYSESGLFVDELQGLNLILPKNAADCTSGNLWELMQTARTEGVLQWRTDTMMYVNKRAKRKRNYFSGVIGSDRNNNNKLNIGSSFAGLTMKMATVRGAKARLKRIGLFFESTASIPFVLYDNTSDTPVESWTLNATANKVEWNTLPTPVELPLVREIPRPYQFWLVYPKASAPRPLANEITCGCGELKRLNVWSPTPVFKNLTTPEARYNWLDWMVISGTEGNYITTRENGWNHNSGSAYGILLDMEFVCNANELLCSGTPDYENDTLAMAQAYGIRFSIGAKLIDMILSSAKLNRYTMLDREALYGKRNHYRKQADEYAQWVAQEITRKERINLENDCFTCYDSREFTLGSIRITN